MIAFILVFAALTAVTAYAIYRDRKEKDDA